MKNFKDFQSSINEAPVGSYKDQATNKAEDERLAAALAAKQAQEKETLAKKQAAEKERLHKEDKEVEDYEVKKYVDINGNTVSRKVHPHKIVDREGKEEMKEQNEMLSFLDYLEEALIGKQKKLDKNNNGKLDSQDFKMLRKEATSNTGDSEPAPKKGKDLDSCSCSMNTEEVDQIDEAGTKKPKMDPVQRARESLANPKIKAHTLMKHIEAAKKHNFERGKGYTFEEVEQIEEATPGTKKPKMDPVQRARESLANPNTPARTLMKHIEAAKKHNFERGKGYTFEEVEQIEERNKENAIRRKNMDASRGARYKLNNPVPDPEPEHKTAQAHNKAIGRALRNEASMVGMPWTKAEREHLEKIDKAKKVTPNDVKVSLNDLPKDKPLGRRRFKQYAMPGSKLKEDADQIQEESIGDHDKLRAYADKRGGMDKKDLHTAANHMESGDTAALKQHLSKMDTDPRDKVLDHVNKAHWGKLGYKSVHEDEQIDELNRNTLASYAGKAAGDMFVKGSKAEAITRGRNITAALAVGRKADVRQAGITRAAKNLANPSYGVKKEEVEQIEEKWTAKQWKQYEDEKAAEKKAKRDKANEFKKHGITTEKRGGDDAYSHHVLHNGKSVVSGLHRSQVPHYMNQVLTKVKEKHASQTSQVKEEAEQIEEGFINGRDYASHGLMHPEHAGQSIHKVTGKEIDFYGHGTGDKIQGKVTMNNGKYVHIRASKSSGGALHKFKVTPHLPKEANEEVEIQERELSTAEMNKREEVVKSMKKSYKDFKDRYGSRAKEVMYATATNVAKKSK